MKLATFFHRPDQGWSLEPFPELDSENTLVLLFGSSGYRKDQQAFADINRAYPQSQVAGCSSAGEIFGATVQDDSLVASVVRFEENRLRAGSAPINQADQSFSAGKQLAEELCDEDLKGILVLSPGVQVNGSDLVAGMNSVLPDTVIVTGGLAGDGDRFESTWVLKTRVPQTDHVSGIGFYGPSIRIGHGSKGGWDIFGPERRVTRSHGNVLYELDGKPALELYKRYLGNRAQDLPASALLFPLAVRSDASEQKQIVRTVLAIDEKSQSMIFAGDIPEGSLSQLMKANHDRLIDGAAEAAREANFNSKTGPNLSIAISCVGRRLVLGGRTEEELEAVLEMLPEGTQQVGFYSYGEISPYQTGHCDLHNQTMTLTTLSEETSDVASTAGATA